MKGEGEEEKAIIIDRIKEDMTSQILNVTIVTKYGHFSYELSQK